MIREHTRNKVGKFVNRVLLAHTAVKVLQFQLLVSLEVIPRAGNLNAQRVQQATRAPKALRYRPSVPEALTVKKA